MSITSVSYFTASGQVSFHDVATIGPIEWIAPFEGATQNVYFRQAYQQAITAWSPLAMDTAHPTSTTYLLVREADYAAIGAGQHTWNRYYACTAPTRIEYTSYAAAYPYVTGTSGVASRDGLLSISPAKITYEYFLTTAGPPSLANAASVTYAGGVVRPLLDTGTIIYNTTGSTPNSSDYNSLIAGGAVVITAEPQTLERWVGNFYARKTIFVQAK